MRDQYYRDAMRERIFNRGLNRRFIAYFIYFMFNAYMTTELILLEMHWFYVVLFAGFVAVLWIELQKQKVVAFEIEQFKFNELFGFLVMIILTFCYFKLGKYVGDKHYVLVALTTIILLHKVFCF